MSKNFYILLLLIEYIKNYKSIITEFYNNSDNTNLINVIEINEAFNDNYAGIELNLTTLDLIDQNYLYFYYNYEFTPSSRITTFRLLFFPFLQNYSVNQNDFEIKCLLTDINSNLLALKNISINESNCIGSFDKNNKSKYNGIININYKELYNNISYKDIDKLKLLFIIKNEWNAFSEIKLYIRKNIYNLIPQEGTIEEKEEYSLIPYYINLSDFKNITNEIIFYSSTNELQLYYLNSNFDILYRGNIILLYTNKNMISLKYNNIEEMILFTQSLDNNDYDIEFHEKNISKNNFEIKFGLEYIKIINYYLFESFPYNEQISLQMIEQNVKYCFILNYQKEDYDSDIINEQNYTKLFTELIYGDIKSIYFYNNLNYSTWDEFIKNGQKLDLNDIFYILNYKKNYVINMICAENNNIPSMMHFYFNNKDLNKSSSYIELNLGETYANYIQNGSHLDINIKDFNNNEIDLTLHAFNNESLIKLEINFGNDTIKLIEKNSIEGFKIKVENEEKKLLRIYNKGDCNCNVIIKISFEINENNDKIDNNIFYNSKNNLYYFKFPKLYDYYKYSKIIINIESDKNNLISFNNINSINGKYFLIDSFNSIINPIADNFYLNINSYSTNSTFELLNPFIMKSKSINNNNILNYYLIMKPSDKIENIKIQINFEKYDFFQEVEFNTFYVLKIPEKNESGIIIPSENRPKSYIQMFSCEIDKLIHFEIYNSFYKNQYISDYLPSEQYHFYNVEENLLDLSISFKEKNGKNANVFINHFTNFKALNETINKKFVIEYNNVTNSIHLIKPINATFNYTIFLDKKGSLLDKNISLCEINSINGLNKIAYYIKNISDEDFFENEYKLNFSSSFLKNYKSFDMILYAKEFPYGMHFLSDIISNEYIEEKKAILVENILEKNNEKMLYYIGKMESFNYYKIDTEGYYENIITIHFGIDFDLNKINIDCAQIKSNLVKDIKTAMIEQKNREICKIIDIKNKNNKIVIVFVKMIKNLYNSLAIRILNEFENSTISIFMDINDLNIKKEIIIDDEEENKLIDINHPYCFKYYKIYLDDINNNKYNQIGLYSQIRNSISLLINNNINEKILIDYGNFIIINTNDNYIINNYYQNKELIIIIGDNSKQVLNINDMDIEPIKLNIIGLTKKLSNEKYNKINFIDYYAFNNLINLNEIFIPIYINKCDNSLNNYVVLNIKENPNFKNKKIYIKISLDFGDIPMIEYSNILDKESFNDVINNLISINLKEKNLILYENNIYIFKIICTNYIYMNINLYEAINDQKSDNYTLKSGTLLDISLKSQEIINLDLNKLKDSNLTKIELLNEHINFEVEAEIDKNEIINLNSTNRILLLELDKKEIKTITIKTKNKSGYIQIKSNINNSELLKEENIDYLSYNNKELYIYSHKIEPNNDLITINIPIINKEKSKYISVCYYLSQIIFKNKNIPNCITISENSFENITIRNPYNIYDNNYIYNISNIYIILYKDGKNNDNKLELKEVIIEEEGKNNKDKKDNGKKGGENTSTKVGKAVLILFIIIIIFFVIFLVFIYIRKLNIKKREMNYQASINNENELFSQGNNPLMGNILSLND